MFEFRYDTCPDIDAYLERIDYAGSKEPTLENLHALIRAHQSTVPFENLDVCLTKTPICLEVNSLFDKIVTRHRGGYCFELNGLFLTLLLGLGYDAYSCFCRISSFSDQLRPIKHEGIVVTLEGKRYFCDVGFGGAMAPFAVELSPERQTRDEETFWIEPAEQGWFQLRRLSGHGLQDTDTQAVEKSVTIFAPIAALSGDFEAYSYQCWAMPNSPFIHAPSVSIRRPDGYVNLNGDILTYRSGDTVSNRTITEEEFPQVLKKYFGILL